MRCKNCDYPLWQITDRRCPECGTGFKPSDYEFILNSVRFCCPHCSQDYYGTGEKGHLVPRSFACVKCATLIDMDEMVLLPTEGVTEQQTRVTVVPWVERRDRNWFSAFFVTMGMAIGNPNRTIEAVPEGSSPWRAIWYMAIHLSVQMVMSCVPIFVWAIAMSAAVASGAGATVGMFAAGVGTVLGAPLLVILWAWIAHGWLRITGGTAAGFPRTLHAFCYSAGNNFVCAVPCFGMYLLPFSGLWWTISAGFMLARAQSVSKLRALLVTVVPLVLLIGLGVGGIVAAVFAASRASAVAMATVAMPPMYTSNSQAGMAMAQKFQFAKSYPTHAGEWLLDRFASPAEYLLPGSASTTAAATVQNITLSGLGFSMAGASTLRAKLLADPALQGPEHRVGDWVFTYAGVSPGQTDIQLWLAIGWPDPALNSSGPSEVVVVRPTGLHDEIPAAEFDAALKTQNAIRAGHKLPPLTHPGQVRATSVPAPASPAGGAPASSPQPAGNGSTPSPGDDSDG